MCPQEYPESKILSYLIRSLIWGLFITCGMYGVESDSATTGETLRRMYVADAMLSHR